jgi:hypothetical protein
MNARDTTADTMAAEPGAPAAVETMLELRQATKKYAAYPPSRRSTSRCAAARSTRCSARTAPASRR